VIADHIRACSFLIVDGVLPSNEGRGYVLRRIIRRALRHGWMLGCKDDFFFSMVNPLVECMGDAYPELVEKRALIESALLNEERRFGETLSSGMKRFQEGIRIENRVYEFIRSGGASNIFGPINMVVKEPRVGGGHTWDFAFEGADGLKRFVELKVASRDLSTQDFLGWIEQIQRMALPNSNDIKELWIIADGSGEGDLASKIREAANQASLIIRFYNDADFKVGGGSAFVLYDTFGFPLDLTSDMAREQGLSVDLQGFEAAMEKQRELARSAGKFGGGVVMPAELIAQLAPTAFLGYDGLQADDLEVVAILKDGKPVDLVAAGDDAVILLDRTPFYAESGGQVGDTGRLSGAGADFEVGDTQKLAGQFHGHVGRLVAGSLRRGDRLNATVDPGRRQATVLNHSATHLLHAALRDVLGTHVTQKGSLVAPDRLRFDFSHFQPLTPAELAEIERRVNAEIRANSEAEVHHMGMQEALDFGAMALFGEKYGERVRVLRMGDASTELCGGTHVRRTGDIGVFKIVSEGGIQAGVRRIEAVTGQGALDLIAEEERRLDEAAALLGGNPADVAEKLRALLDRQKKLERELESLKARAAGAAVADLAASAAEVGGIRVLAARLEGMDAKALRDAVDRLKAELRDAVVLLAGAADGKVSLIAGVSGAALGPIKAGDLMAHVAGQIGGKGGGRTDMAQGGGEDGPRLRNALEGIQGWVEERMRPGA
jgi:alanyl-tRNA synthetase